MKQLVVIKYTTTLLKVMFADLKILENCRWNSIGKNESLGQFQRSKDKNLGSIWRAFCYLHLFVAFFQLVTLSSLICICVFGKSFPRSIVDGNQQRAALLQNHKAYHSFRVLQ